MVRVKSEVAAEYRAAWEGWQKQLETMHRVFLDAEAMAAPQLKGLLNREARAKERYDAARRALLGLPEESLLAEGSVALAPPGPPDGSVAFAPPGPPGD